MNTMPINIMDLKPVDAKFRLSTVEKELTIGRWSLRVRNWAIERFGHEEIKKIFEQQKISEIAEIAFFMLREKDLFPDSEEMSGHDKFLDAIVSPQDTLNVIKAVIGAVGIGEPELKKIGEALGDIPKAKGVKTEQVPNPKKKTGAKSSTR